MGAKLKSDIASLAPDIEVEPELRKAHPEPTTEEEKIRFQYRNNYPYRRQDGRRQQLKGDFGIRDERRTTSTTTSTTPRPRPPTPAPHNAAGPFVTPEREVESHSESARQPKDYDYGSGSRLNEVRVLPPKEFRHLLAQVDGIEERKVRSKTFREYLPPG